MHALLAILRQEARAAWRHRWTGIALAWLLAVLGWGAVMVLPNQFETRARLFVDADAVLTPLLRGIAVDTTFGQQVDIWQRTLLSRPNLERIVNQTALSSGVHGPSDLERLVNELSGKIKVQPETRGLFTVSYRASDARLAFDVVSLLVRTFTESTSDSNRSGLENAAAFLETQLASYEDKLREAERRRADFKAKYVDVLASDANGGVSHLEESRAALRQLRGSLTDAQAKSDALRRELADTPPLLVTESDPGGGGGGSSRLQEAQRALQDLRVRYTEQHPDVIAARERVAALRAGGDQGPQTTIRPARNKSAPNPVYEQLKIRLVENDSVISSLQRQLSDAVTQEERLEAIARGTPGLQAEFVNINRDYDVLRRNYEELLARRESMRIATAAETSQDKVRLRVVDPPIMPLVPVAPRRALFAAAVLFAALTGGAALPFVLVRLDGAIRTPGSLTDFGFPLLGSIARVPTPVSLRARVMGAVMPGGAVLLLCVAFGVLLVRIMVGQAAA